MRHPRVWCFFIFNTCFREISKHFCSYQEDRGGNVPNIFQVPKTLQCIFKLSKFLQCFLKLCFCSLQSFMYTLGWVLILWWARTTLSLASLISWASGLNRHAGLFWFKPTMKTVGRLGAVSDVQYNKSLADKCFSTNRLSSMKFSPCYYELFSIQDYASLQKISKYFALSKKQKKEKIMFPLASEGAGIGTKPPLLFLTWMMFSCISRMIRLASVARFPLIRASWSSSAFVLQKGVLIKASRGYPKS